MGLNNNKAKGLCSQVLLLYVLILLALYSYRPHRVLSVFELPNLVDSRGVHRHGGREFVGGLLGALGGMLLDLGAFSVFGFYSIQLLVICGPIGLLVIYLMKNNLLSAAILCGGRPLGIT